MSTIFDDPEIEESKIKSCLIFSKRVIKEKNDSLLQKYILSILISGEAKNRDGILRYIARNRKDSIIDEAKLDSSLSNLEKNGFISIDGTDFILSDDTQKDSDDFYSDLKTRIDTLIEDILARIKSDYKSHLNNENQVRANIKNCINYYYAVSGISFFDLDDKKDVAKLGKLEDIAADKLGQKEGKELKDIIIYAIGDIINSPTESQKRTFEDLARLYITTQVMNIDPVLRNFKTTIIREKVFILDTEVVLFAITDNATFSKQYKQMISQLIACRCKLYIPEEIIQEVFDHAQAASKRYHYVSHLIDNNDSLVCPELKNIFIEDYYFIHQSNSHSRLTWSQYLSNFYNEEFGLAFTRQQIIARLGDKIQYGKIPPVNIPDNERWQLETEALKSTEQTEKALYREDSKNETIAKNDTLLYLSAKYLNKANIEQEGKKLINRDDLLMFKYYVLSHLTRIHKCAHKLGFDAKVLCRPSSLLAYLAETGILADDKAELQSLFDNPFIMHIANIVWPDIEKLLHAGVDVSHQNLVTLRFNLQKEINAYLTEPTADGYRNFYEEASKKGIDFTDEIQAILTEKKGLEVRLHEKDLQLDAFQKTMQSKFELMEKRMNSLQNQLDERDKTIERQNKVIRKKDYDIRMLSSIHNKKGGRNRK